MHPNPVYRQTPEADSLAFARRRGFGVLALNGAGGDAMAGPLLSHIPFLLDADGREAEFHLVRSNPIARALASGAAPAVLAVTGPDGYISPDWYGIDAQVPTWNYVAVHLRGEVSLAPVASLRGHLDRLSARFEGDLAPKQPWTADKVPPEALERMMRQIVPCRMAVVEVQSTWKLSQNKPEAARLGAADGVEAAGTTPGNPGGPALARLMRATRSG